MTVEMNDLSEIVMPLLVIVTLLLSFTTRLNGVLNGWLFLWIIFGNDFWRIYKMMLKGCLDFWILSDFTMLCSLFFYYFLYYIDYRSPSLLGLGCFCCFVKLISYLRLIQS